MTEYSVTGIVSNCMAGLTCPHGGRQGFYKRFHLKKTLFVGPFLIFPLPVAGGDTGVSVSLAGRPLTNRFAGQGLVFYYVEQILWAVDF